MSLNRESIASEVEVISYEASTDAERTSPITLIVSPPSRALLPLWAAGLLFVLGVAFFSGLLAWMWHMRESQVELRRETEAVVTEFAASREMATGMVIALQQSLAEKDARLAALELEAAALQKQTQELEEGPAMRKAIKQPASPGIPATKETLSVPIELPEPSPAVVPIEAPDPNLQAAIEATQALASTSIEEPPSLEQIRAHIKAKDPRVATNKGARDERSFLMKTLSHPIFVDSAVLTASLFVPPSLPLTLAQSRLGRSLTRRAMKESDLDKTVAGQVATDVGNMPITMKKKKK